MAKVESVLRSKGDEFIIELPDGMYGKMLVNPKDGQADNLPSAKISTYIKLKDGYVFLMEKGWDHVDFMVWLSHD